MEIVILKEVLCLKKWINSKTPLKFHIQTTQFNSKRNPRTAYQLRGGGGVGEEEDKNQQIKEEDKTPIYHFAKPICTNQKSTKARNSQTLPPNVL